MDNNQLNFSGADVDPEFVDQASHRNPYSRPEDILATGRSKQGDYTGRSYRGPDQPMDDRDVYNNPNLIDEQNVREPRGGAFGTTRAGHTTSGIDSDYYRGDSQAQNAASERRQSLSEKIKEGYERLTGQTAGDNSNPPYDGR